MVGYNNEKELIEKRVSFKIDEQFPGIYREQGPELVQLVKDYYKFLETEVNQHVYLNRRMFEYRDISTTASEMIIFFQKMFLSDLPLLSDTDVKFVIKNIMDLYRRKGTRGGIIVFFRMFYQEDATVVYPSKFMFKPSDSAWKTGTYLQMVPNNNEFVSSDGILYTYQDLINKNIRGSSSGAKAVVDKINFILQNQTIFPIIYINNIRGNFRKYDDIIARMGSEDVSFGKMGGSLNQVNPIDLAWGGTTGNKVGDIYNVRSDYGQGAKVLVSEVSEQQTGQVEYNLTDGGFGYTIENTRLEVSNQVIVFDNERFLFKELQNLEQNSTGASGRVIGQNSLVVGIQLDSGSPEFANTTFIQTTSETPQVNSVKLFTNSETVEYNTTFSFIEGMQYAVNRLEPHASRFRTIINGKRLGDLNQNGTFGQGDVDLLQQYYDGTLEDKAVKVYIETIFNDHVEGNPTAFSDYVGHKAYYDTVAPRNDTSPGPLYPDTSNPSDVRVESLSYPETVSLITDVIDDFVNVPLDSLNYNTVPPAAQAMSGTADPVTINTPLDEAFDLTPFDIGVIDSFVNINPGSDYINDVFALVRDPVMIPFARHEQVVIFQNFTAAFSVGEIVQQAGSLVYGKITEVNSTEKYIKVRPYSYYGMNSTGSIIFKGNTYPVLAVERDYSSEVIGESAEMETQTIFENGRIKAVTVINSGFSYVDGEQVYIVNEDGDLQAKGTAVVQTEGITEGYWGELTSHVNGFVKTVEEDGVDDYYDSTMKIQDSDYYQEYSYDIKSAVPEETYRDALHKNVHLAGTKQFSSFLYQKKQDTGLGLKFYQRIKKDYEPGGTDVVGPGQDLDGQGKIRASSTAYTSDSTILTTDVTN